MTDPEVIYYTARFTSEQTLALGVLLLVGYVIYTALLRRVIR